MTSISKFRSAFTLVELMIVISLVAILLAMVGPAVTGPLLSTRISSTAAQIAADLQIARQEAITRNRSVDFYFFSTAGENAEKSAIRHYGAFLRNEDGTVESFLNPTQIPEGVIISTDGTLTSLGGDNGKIPEALPKVLNNSQLFRFAFQPDGSTDLSLSEKWFFTIQNEDDTEIPPANFATIQIEPLTGNTRTYRP